MICTKCKKKIDTDAVFCSNCGNKINKPNKMNKISIGRGEENDIILDFPQISNLHAWLYRDSKSWIIEDRKSTNHTYVNDRSRKVFRKRITENDSIYFGTYRISARRLLAMKADAVLGRSNRHATLLESKETIFGRDPDATIHLDYPQISWHHARLTREKARLPSEKDRFYLYDLNSTNGTFVNGRRIKSCRITPEDEISFGSFTFQLNEDQTIKIRDFREDIRIDVENISYEVRDRQHIFVKKKLRLLDNISLSILPGEFVGLMGPSGSGKTTLMQAVNGYISPQYGCTSINGLLLNKHYDSFRGCFGYVPQDDIIHPELTVYEALYYTAKLRLPTDTSKSEINTLIDTTIKQLGLYNPDPKKDIRGLKIGSPEEKGISGGQRKRVNLAMELLTSPGVLFLDEPTSGLSSQDTLVVMDVLRALADQGKTIILTIHQPSLDAYQKMDNVIILRSGKLMYYGPSSDALTFFNPGMSPERAKKSADNVLKGLSQRDKDEWLEEYQKSSYYRNFVRDRKDTNCKIGNHQYKNSLKKPKFPFDFRQWWILTRRYFKIKSRDRANTVILLLQAPVIALLISLVFYETEPPKSHLYSTYLPCFLLVISAIWFGISNSAGEIVSEKAIYIRERMVNLKIPSYIFSKYTVLSVLCFIQCAILVGIVHPILDLHGKIGFILGAVFLAALAGISIGLFISTLFHTQQAAIAFVPIVLLPIVIIGGGMLPVAKMNSTSVILSYLVPSRWAYEQVIHVENKGYDAKIKKDQKKQTESKKINFVDNLFGEKHKKSDIVILTVIVVIFNGYFIILAMYALKRKDLL